MNGAAEKEKILDLVILIRQSFACNRTAKYRVDLVRKREGAPAEVAKQTDPRS